MQVRKTSVRQITATCRPPSSESGLGFWPGSANSRRCRRRTCWQRGSASSAAWGCRAPQGPLPPARARVRARLTDHWEHPSERRCHRPSQLLTFLPRTNRCFFSYFSSEFYPRNAHYILLEKKPLYLASEIRTRLLPSKSLRKVDTLARRNELIFIYSSKISSHLLPSKTLHEKKTPLFCQHFSWNKRHRFTTIYFTIHSPIFIPDEKKISRVFYYWE